MSCIVVTSLLFDVTIDWLVNGVLFVVVLVGEDDPVEDAEGEDDVVDEIDGPSPKSILSWIIWIKIKR